MEKKETLFSDLCNYLNNNLAHDKMKEVEDSIIDNGEAEMAYHTLMFDYQYNRKYIDSLIGRDEEEFEEKESENCQNYENRTLKEKQTRDKNLKNEEIMATLEGSGLPENMESVKTAIETMQPEIEKMMEGEREDYEKHGMEILMDQYGMTESGAKKVVSGLLEGIKEFDARHELISNQDTQGLRERIEQQLTEKTEEEKKNFLINSIVALKTLKGESVTKEAVQAVMDSLKGESVEKLISGLTEVMVDEESYATILANMDGMEQKLSEGDLEKLRNILMNSTLATKFYTALALYMAQSNKVVNLFVDDEHGIDPRVIGSAAAVAIAMMDADMQLQEGTIDRPTWMKWMKYILGGLFATTLFIADLVLVSAISVGLVLTLMALFGQGVIAAFIALGITFVIMKPVTEKSIDLLFNLLDILDKPYDKVMDKIVAIVKQGIDLIKEMQKSKTDKKKEDETEQHSKEKVNAPQTESVSTTNDGNFETDQSLIYS